MNKQIEKQIADLGEVYENAKDQLIRLTIQDGDHELQTNVFSELKKLRNIAGESLQLIAEFIEVAELAKYELNGREKSTAYKGLLELLGRFYKGEEGGAV